MTEDQELKRINDIIDRAVSEDLGDSGDVTSDAVFTEDCRAEAVIKSKQSGVLSGAYLLEPLFGRINPDVKLRIFLGDGELLQPGNVICALSGPVKGILAGERIALNFLQRLSGIATMTSQYVNAISFEDY